MKLQGGYQSDKYWIVRKAVGQFLDYYLEGGTEAVIWGRKTEYEPLPTGTKTDHDAGMIGKVSRLHNDSPDLPIISKILSNLPVPQFHAICAFYRYYGICEDTGKAYTGADKARLVGQTEPDFEENTYKAKREIYMRLTNIDAERRAG